MAKHRIALLPGDGIGTEVVNESVRMLKALSKIERGLKFEFTRYPWGSDFYHKTGRMAPENYLDKLAKHDTILLGAVGRPDIPDHITLQQLLLPIRRAFDLYINVRPIILFEGLEAPLKGYGPGDIDMLFFRENVEGEYSPAGGRHYEGFPTEIAIQNCIFTRQGCERIIKAAFEAALKRKRKHVTNVTKSNAQGYTLVLWDEVFEEVAARPRYKKIKTAKFLVDAAALEFVRRPEIFDVVVASNLFADILTDLGAGIVGGLGVAPSANIGAAGFPGFFEPVHGSAPDIMGKGIANPVATMFASAMMLDHLGESRSAKRVDAAVRAHLAGGHRTRDLGGDANTRQAANDIIKRL
ncbi:MAG: tartrate dehydrogenase [Nitrospinaceae bacterium]|jgi:tartrate dehydrogenase/decarboxylase / D-malate dehydrogenase|nr:tartrate dehydrogenase [Nitrospinaceae bacterium]MBT3822588.1 tartrate dehydrogenase [Nitrospinaceae bacterium]MBT4094240.1 tartrate dehydrogenase [Nitrospinaceae bacterium]MBT4432498.1 tartrate dehydrogenase [Nitrospinaceae bacterium]MBT5946254.1 tartrate dehydrogenase [Nitrospinaceae bacterium]